MFKMRTLIAMSLGYAAGYVAGAKAGRPAYDRISAMANEYAERLGMATGSSPHTVTTGPTSRATAAGPTSPRATAPGSSSPKPGSEPGATATDLANEEIGDLRNGRVNGVPGRPDAGREHGATVVPS